jgi:uncharacterized damage-inducible protein DinB
MDIQTIQLLAGYNEKTNGEMNAIVSRMDADQWNHGFNAFFPSIRLICNHIYIADFTWLRRFSLLRDFRYFKDTVFSREISFAEDAFVTREDYLTKRQYLDRLIVVFADEVTEADLGNALTYKDIRGTENTRNFGGLILHLFNHQTHHRGMISVYLEMLGIQNDYSNLARLV